MKRGQKAEFTIVHDQFNNTEIDDGFFDSVLPTQIPGYDSSKDLFVTVTLHKLTKVEDWYKDGTTLVRTLRKGGKGRSPYADSDIKRKIQPLINLL
jgi:hypothetical protein